MTIARAAAGGTERRAGLPARLWRYQAERFPLRRHGPLILVFSGAAVGHAERLGRLAGAGPASPGGSGAAAVAIATAVVLLQFLLMRLADEVKDAEADRRWRPHRPVPRGLVSLPELAGLGLAATALQWGLVLLWRPAALPLLAAVWGWFLLMGAEFFRPAWLRQRLGLYALSHLPIVPLLALLAMGLRAPLPPLPALLPFLVCSYGCGLGLELARKTWRAEAERPGVESYSAHWGPQRALAAWRASLLLAAIGAVAAAAVSRWWLALLPLLPLLALILGRRQPWAGGGDRRDAAAGDRAPLEAPTGLWILAVYLSLGWWPWLAGGWSP